MLRRALGRHPLAVTFSLLLVAPLVFAACGGTGSGSAESTTAAPSAPVAAVAAPAKTFLMVDGDTARGGFNLAAEEKSWLDCVQANRFPQGSGMVFRAKVIDPLTGKALDDKSVKSVTVTLADGSVKDMQYIGRPTKAPTDYFWRFLFKVPADYPTGSFSYHIDAVGMDGRTGQYNQIQLASLMAQIVPLGTR